MLLAAEELEHLRAEVGRVMREMVALVEDLVRLADKSARIPEEARASAPAAKRAKAKGKVAGRSAEA